MIERIIDWLKEGEENEAADTLAACSLNYLYVDTFFDLSGDRSFDMFDVNIEAPRKIIKEIENLPNVKDQIEAAIHQFAQTSNEHIRHIVWAHKFSTLSGGSAEDQVTKVLAKIDSEYVHRVWNKALKRKTSDPEGAITLARTLVEAVCKFILENASIGYPANSDLPKLYHLVADHLQLAPSQHSSKIVRQLLGNSQAVVSGIANLRNEFGDAHGKGNDDTSPDSSHAELAVNLAGAIATFLVSRWENFREPERL